MVGICESAGNLLRRGIFSSGKVALIDNLDAAVMDNIHSHASIQVDIRTNLIHIFALLYVCSFI